MAALVNDCCHPRRRRRRCLQSRPLTPACTRTTPGWSQDSRSTRKEARQWLINALAALDLQEPGTKRRRFMQFLPGGAACRGAEHTPLALAALQLLFETAPAEVRPLLRALGLPCCQSSSILLYAAPLPDWFSVETSLHAGGSAGGPGCITAAPLLQIRPQARAAVVRSLQVRVRAPCICHAPELEALDGSGSTAGRWARTGLPTACAALPPTPWAPAAMRACAASASAPQRWRSMRWRTAPRCGACWSGRGGTRRRRWRWRSGPTTFANWMCRARCATC